MLYVTAPEWVARNATSSATLRRLTALARGASTAWRCMQGGVYLICTFTPRYGCLTEDYTWFWCVCDSNLGHRPEMQLALMLAGGPDVAAAGRDLMRQAENTWPLSFKRDSFVHHVCEFLARKYAP